MKATTMDLDFNLEELERQIADYAGRRFAVVCSSARTAIRFSLLALGIGHGDSVVIPDFACQIMPITVFCTGARPRFCDIDRETLALSTEHLNSILQPDVKALIFVHYFGLPADPRPIVEIAQEKGIVFIDDAAQGLGASISGRKLGSFGDVGILTFNKLLDVDVGGAVVTDREELANRVKVIRTSLESKSFIASFGYGALKFLGLASRNRMRMISKSDGYAYEISKVILARKHFEYVNGWINAKPRVLEMWRSNELSDSVINQLLTYEGRYWHRRRLEKMEISLIGKELKSLDSYVEKRTRIAKVYSERINKEGMSLIKAPESSVSSYMRYPILFSSEKHLATCISRLVQTGFRIDYRYKQLHMSPLFKKMNIDHAFSGAEYVSRHILPLPTDPRMEREKLERVISTVNSCLADSE